MTQLETHLKALRERNEMVQLSEIQTWTQTRKSDRFRLSLHWVDKRGHHWPLVSGVGETRERAEQRLVAELGRLAL